MNSIDMQYKPTLSAQVEQQVLAVSTVVGLQPGTVNAVFKFLKVIVDEDPMALVPVLAVLTAEQVEDINNLLMEIQAHLQNNS